MHTFNEKNLPCNIYSLSEDAVTIEFGNHISDELFKQVSSFNQLVTQNPFPGFTTTLPAYATLTIFFDVLQVASSQLIGISCFDKVRGYLFDLSKQSTESITHSANTITIPVCYGGDFGPDLELVATHHGIAPEQVVKLHSEARYKVYMLGFLPGFAYLGGLPKELEMPRKSAPRKVVPAGSVGIAAMQTGVYPFQSPGGWQIIGRTPLKMFNAAADNPVLLKPGDEVVFKPITAEEFQLMKEANDAD